MKLVAARRVKPSSRQHLPFSSQLRQGHTQHDGVILEMSKVDQEKSGLKEESEERYILFQMCQISFQEGCEEKYLCPS